MGGPKVFVVATLASSRPASPFAFRNYELPDEATPIAEQLSACAGSCKHHVWEVGAPGRPSPPSSTEHTHILYGDWAPLHATCVCLRRLGTNIVCRCMSILLVWHANKPLACWLCTACAAGESAMCTRDPATYVHASPSRYLASCSLGRSAWLLTVVLRCRLCEPRQLPRTI
jgi:hypothetical protein